MYRLDMKPDLCDNAVASLPRGRRREVLSNALLWLLDKQWISIKMHTGRCFTVCRGSGMGLVHSSGVCDAALFVLVEQSWATKVEVQPAFAIHAYYRFQYDIWILAGHRSLARRFISRFRDLASRVFESELVECSAHLVEMIGVITTIEGNRIHTEPRQKYKGTPLSQQSAHPLKVHLRLPAVYMRVEVDLCLTDQRREHVRSEFVKRFSTKLCFKSSVGFIDQCSFCIKNEVEEKRKNMC